MSIAMQIYSERPGAGVGHQSIYTELKGDQSISFQFKFNSNTGDRHNNKFGVHKARKNSRPDGWEPVGRLFGRFPNVTYTEWLLSQDCHSCFPTSFYSFWRTTSRVINQSETSKFLKMSPTHLKFLRYHWRRWNKTDQRRNLAQWISKFQQWKIGKGNKYSKWITKLLELFQYILEFWRIPRRCKWPHSSDVSVKLMTREQLIKKQGRIPKNSHIQSKNSAQSKSYFKNIGIYVAFQCIIIKFTVKVRNSKALNLRCKSRIQKRNKHERAIL